MYVLLREREFHVNVPLSAGYRAALSQWAAQCSGHLISGANTLIGDLHDVAVH